MKKLRINYPALLFKTLLLLALPASMLGQTTVFQRLFELAGHYETYGLVTCADGSFLLCGRTNLTGSAENGFVMMVNEVGEFLWAKEYVGALNDYIYDGIELPNGDFVVCGFTASFGSGSENAFIMRLDPSGNPIWAKYYGSNGYDYWTNLVSDGAGGFYCGGYTPTPSVTRLDSAGNRLWTKQVNGVQYGNMALIVPSYGSGPVIAFPGIGNNSTFGIYRLSPSGTLQWSAAYTHANATAEGRIHIIEHPTRQLWLTYSMAGSGTNQNSFDPVVCRLDSLGGLLSAYSYGSAGLDQVTGSVAAADSSIVLIGHTNRIGNGDVDPFLMRIGYNGNSMGCRNYGGVWNERPWDVKATADGGWAFAGFGFEGVDSMRPYLCKVDALANENCSTLPWTPVKHIANMNPPSTTPNPTSTGYPNSGNITWNVLSRSFDTDRFCEGPVGSEEITHSRQWAVAPNPASSTLAVSRKGAQFPSAVMYLHNSVGQLVKEWKLSGEFHQLDISDLPPAIYFYSIHDNLRLLQFGKLIVQ